MPFSAETYRDRRERFGRLIGPGAAALFVSSPESVRSNDVEYRYRQDNHFLYLTGFHEPGAACVLRPGHAEPFVMFVRPRNPEQETWTGRRAGVEGAVERYGANAAFPIGDLQAKLGELLGDAEKLYFGLGRNGEANGFVLDWLQKWQKMRPRSAKGPATLVDPADLVSEMRLFKSEDELVVMRTAAQISADAHRAAMQAACAGMREFEIEALIEYEFRRAGGAGPAYPSIVAGGDNATILHYIDNDRPLRGDELLLIDAGVEFDDYCADITRTFPVGRRFTDAQRAIYEIVLEAQIAAIESVKPGVAVEFPHERAVRIMVEGLCRLGVLSGSADEAIEKGTYRRYYMHRTSHWLGMDVHDVGSYKSGDGVRLLEPGMVLTIEPGLYFGPDTEASAMAYRGIGIRIEDDVLVTAQGCEVLTSAAPKSIAEIEAIREGVGG